MNTPIDPGSQQRDEDDNSRPAPQIPPAYPPAYPTSAQPAQQPQAAYQPAAQPGDPQAAQPAATQPYAAPGTPAAQQAPTQPAYPTSGGQHVAQPAQPAPQSYPQPASQPASPQTYPPQAYPGAAQQPAAQPAAPQAYPQPAAPQAYPQPGTPAAPSSSPSVTTNINAAASQMAQKAAQSAAGDHIKFLWTSAQQLFKGQVTEVGQQLLTRKVPGVITYVVWAVCAGLMVGVFKYRATSAITGAFAQLTGDTSASSSAFGSAFATFFGVAIAFLVFGLLWAAAVYLALRWSKSKLDYAQTFSLVWGMGPYFIPLMVIVFLWSLLTSASGLLAFGVVAFPLGMFFTLLHEFQMLQCVYTITGANQKFPLLMAITATVFFIIVLPILELTVPLLFAFA